MTTAFAPTVVKALILTLSGLICFEVEYEGNKARCLIVDEERFYVKHNAHLAGLELLSEKGVSEENTNKVRVLLEHPVTEGLEKTWANL